jgi:hypothetical protein
MNAQLAKGRLSHFKHAGKDILELGFSGCSPLEAEKQVEGFSLLLALVPRPARVLVDVSEAPPGGTLLHAWTSRLEFFEGKIAKSAVVGGGSLLPQGIRDVSMIASRRGIPLGNARGVAFQSREDALDWLSLDF